MKSDEVRTPEEEEVELRRRLLTWGKPVESRNRKGSLQRMAEQFFQQLEENFENVVIGHRAPKEAIVNDPVVQLNLERHAAEDFLNQLIKHFEGDR